MKILIRMNKIRFKKLKNFRNKINQKLNKMKN